jgi:3-oxoacyl-[acyl-carrier-protein] synthase-3
MTQVTEGGEAVSDPVVIAGVGFAVPDETRGNEDPIFEWLHAHEPAGVDLFKGYISRRVLSADQELVDLLIPAARMAIADAGAEVSDIDMLTGFASLGRMYTPNPLALLHQKLGLLDHAGVLPIANDYANFTAGLALATALIETGRAKTILVACGSNWTRHVDYHTPQCIAAGDGAGAVVVSRRNGPDRFTLVDIETITESALYGSMFVAGDVHIDPSERSRPVIPGFDDRSFSWPYFQITDRGHDAFFSFGQQRPVEAVRTLLERNGVPSSSITLIAHQASSVLLDYWHEHINPSSLLDTLKEYADIPHANLPVTLAAKYAEIHTEYLVLLTVGIEFSTTAMLLARAPST